MIRAYREKDLDPVLDAWYSASKVAHSFLDANFLEQERRNIATRYLPNAETWVFEKDGRAVGFISLNENEVGGLFVDAQFHRQGIGRALMDHARNSRDVLTLDVFKDNAVGRAFYEQYGFAKVGEYLHEETGFVMLRLRLSR